MRLIKQFENFNKFKLLDREHAVKYNPITNKPDGFYEKISDKEIKYVQDHTKLNWNKEELRRKDLGTIFKHDKTFFSLIVGNPFGGNRLIVKKVADEWYIVDLQIGGSHYIDDFGSGMYMCDQLDGLVDCVNYLTDKYDDLIKNKDNRGGFSYKEDHYKDFPNI